MEKSLRTSGIFLLVVFCALAFAGCSARSTKDTGHTSTYLESRKSYSTVLKTRGPAPQDWHTERVPTGVTEVSYQSGDLALKAWLAMPKNPQSAKLPAVVYFHGGFALGMSELGDCRPFLDAGFAVMAPTFRGENGNPGNFELLYGEVDDAQAAVQWLADQPRIDSRRIYTFGHSVGGGISALLSLRPDIPVRRGASSGGLYSKEVFYGWKTFVPFDLSIDKEKTLRLLVGNVAFMQREHIAYIGRKDSLARLVPEAESEAKQCGAPLTIIMVEGDHFSSLTAAISAFAETVRFD